MMIVTIKLSLINSAKLESPERITRMIEDRLKADPLMSIFIGEYSIEVER